MLTTCGNFTTCGILEAMCGFVVCVVQNSPNILTALGLYFTRHAQQAIPRDGLLTLLRPPDMYPMTKPGCDCLPRLRCSGSYVGCQVFGKFGSGQKYRSTVSCWAPLAALHICTTAPLAQALRSASSEKLERVFRWDLTVRDPLTQRATGNGLFTLKKMTHTMVPLIHLTVTDPLKYVKSFAK